MNIYEKHYLNTQRVKAHAARTYFLNSKTTYREDDLSTLNTLSALIYSLLNKEGSGLELSNAADDMFSTIATALTRRKGIDYAEFHTTTQTAHTK